MDDENGVILPSFRLFFTKPGYCSRLFAPMVFSLARKKMFKGDSTK